MPRCLQTVIQREKLDHIMAPNVEPYVAVQDFLKERKEEVRKSSHRNYQYALQRLVEFCANQEIEYINNITGYDLKQFKLARREDGIKEVTLKNNLSTIRVFLRWCAQAELVEEGTAEMVQLPPLDRNDRTDDTVLSLDRVENVLDYLYKFEYAHRRHAVFQFIWHTCSRVGTVVAIDVDDYHPKREFVEIRHRPETGTPLKNGHTAERQVNLTEEVCEVLDDYVQTHREVVNDENGRLPLFTTSHGRITRNTIRKNMSVITRPCHISNNCPHERDLTECEATKAARAARCPSSVSPHPLRRSAITYHLNRDWPREKVSERANVSGEVLDEHYDARTAADRRNSRRQYIDSL